jgi:DNA-binding GntR family transcriptional regulator
VGDVPRELQTKPFRTETVERYRLEQTVSAELLEQDIADRIDAQAGTAALVVTRRMYDRTGKLANVGIYTHPAERYSITTTVNP